MLKPKLCLPEAGTKIPCLRNAVDGLTLAGAQRGGTCCLMHLSPGADIRVLIEIEKHEQNHKWTIW